MSLLGKKNPLAGLPELDNKITTTAPTRIIKIQQKIADYLRDRSERVSVIRMITLLILFCLTSSCFSFYFILNAFKTFGQNGLHINTERISVPRYYEKTGEVKMSGVPLKGTSRLTSFKAFMDSLNNSESGRQVYDSIYKIRPHMMDSIQAFERYQSNNNKVYEKRTK